ncbi:MAG TPA: AI-2E family transporter [Caldilineaceae bacterium]|nr:AI-2E family transporter [Caldilineaceae bacterium]
MSQAKPWSSEMGRIWFLILAGATVVFLVAVRSVLPLLGAAILIAYLLYPTVEWLHRQLLRGHARGVAVLLALLLLLVLLFGAVLPLVSNMLEQAGAALLTMAPVVQRVFQDPLVIDGTPITDDSGHPVILADALSRWLESNQLENLLEQNSRTLWAIVNAMTRATMGLFTQILGGLLQTILGGLLFFFIVFYLLQDGATIRHNLIALAPDGYQADVARLLHDLGNVWHNFLRGQLILAIIMGSSMWLIATILGLPHPLFFALVAGLMEFVPNIGPAVALVPPVATALVVQSTTLTALSGLPIAFLVIALWFVMQQLEALILVPLIVGGSLHLHPVIMIAAVIWGASFGGIIGVIIAGPIVATLRILGQYIYGRLTGRAAFLVKTEQPPAPSPGERLRLFRRYWTTLPSAKRLASNRQQQEIANSVQDRRPHSDA